LTTAGLGLGAAWVAGATSARAAADEAADLPKEPFGYCLNTATIRGHKLPLEEEIAIAAKAGYRGFEPWIDNVRAYAERGGSLADIKKRIADQGLSVVGAIGFCDWVGDDDAKRTAGLEQMKRDMDLVARIGGTRIAAPPLGAYNAIMDLSTVAQRYRKLLELGRQMGVVPQLELWGGAKTLHRLSEVAFVLVEAADRDACPLLDVFHIYKGGSDFSSLAMFNGRVMHDFHVNDYPADPPRDKINDSYRVYPGDGVAPLAAIFRTLRSIGYRGMLSLELFNMKYYQQDPLAVARTGLEKIKTLVAKAFS
jgi:sugar phosphate isomerase/epimerase